MSEESNEYDATIFNNLVGKKVIIRDNLAGVYVGTLVEVRTSGVVLGGGPRQIHYWAKGGSVAQIAVGGIGGSDSRVTAPIQAGEGYAFQAPNIAQIIAMADIAYERVMEFPAWTGGM